MTQNSEGAKKAWETRRKRYGEDAGIKHTSNMGKFKGRKGFSAMSFEKRREISLKGVEARKAKK